MRELVGLSAIISAVYTWQVEVVVLGTATLFHLKEELLSLQTAARGHMHVCADHCGRGHTCSGAYLGFKDRGGMYARRKLS